MGVAITSCNQCATRYFMIDSSIAVRIPPRPSIQVMEIIDDRQHEIEAEQERVIERQQDQAQQRRQHNRDTIKQQDGGGFLNRHDVEHAVGKFARVLARQCGLLGTRETVGQIAHNANKLSPLNDFDHDRLQQIQDSGQPEATSSTIASTISGCT